MDLHEYTERNVEVLQLAGEIDLHYAPALRALLDAKANSRCPALLLDLSAVEFIDSSGLAAILDYLREAASFGGRFCIGGAGEQLGWIFEVTNLAQVLPIYRHTAHAKHALATGQLPLPSRQLFVAAA